MKTVKWTVPNISCGHCTHTIKMEVSDLAGVSSVEAEVESKAVTITFDEPATEEQLVAFLKEINYAPVIV